VVNSVPSVMMTLTVWYSGWVSGFMGESSRPGRRLAKVKVCRG
jgi:hypothetical protein